MPKRGKPEAIAYLREIGVSKYQVSKTMRVYEQMMLFGGSDKSQDFFELVKRMKQLKRWGFTNDNLIMIIGKSVRNITFLAKHETALRNMQFTVSEVMQQIEGLGTTYYSMHDTPPSFQRAPHSYRKLHLLGFSDQDVALIFNHYSRDWRSLQGFYYRALDLKRLGYNPNDSIELVQSLGRVSERGFQFAAIFIQELRRYGCDIQTGFSILDKVKGYFDISAVPTHIIPVIQLGFGFADIASYLGALDADRLPHAKRYLIGPVRLAEQFAGGLLSSAFIPIPPVEGFTSLDPEIEGIDRITRFVQLMELNVLQQQLVSRS